MTDWTDRLVTAWMAWDAAPSAASACVERHAAIRAAGLDPRLTHERIAAFRRAGMSVPDAVQSAINEQLQVDPMTTPSIAPDRRPEPASAS